MGKAGEFLGSSRHILSLFLLLFLISTLILREKQLIFSNQAQTDDQPQPREFWHLRKKIVIFESNGGSDKDSNTMLRKDTSALISALNELGWNAVVVKFSTHVDISGLFHWMMENIDGYLSRVDPGQWNPGSFDKKEYERFLQRLLDSGMPGFPTPQDMEIMGAKDILIKVKDSSVGMPDTFLYRTIHEMRDKFPKLLSFGPRVVKRSGGAMGAGIWKVEFANISSSTTQNPLDLTVIAQEAVDNRIYKFILRNFLSMCQKQYLATSSGYIIDQRYLPKISEGEIRVVWIGNQPKYIVHRKPDSKLKAAFSAALNSGAKHSIFTIEESMYSHLVKSIVPEMKAIIKSLEIDTLPWLWTSDFILDGDLTHGIPERLILSEINASCVGFTAFPFLSRNLSIELTNRIRKHYYKK